ncbi:MAG: hypothetical protein PCFJNLEI_01997 [Verrucomicrobiae bacterium]|nr:hypothetical protein [Verrucomicrobiae bacterium]
MAAHPQPDPPVFNTFKRKVYRPFYSFREFQIVLVCLAVLGAVLAWVIWRGRNPDPTLFHSDDSLLTKKEVPIYKRPVEPWIEPGSAVRTTPSLGPFPSEIIGEGWTASAPVGEFDETNLYEKIDGRETFYKSYGFKRLYFLGLASGNLSIDIELFDLGNIGNALGALVAEVAKPDAEFDGLFYSSANAGFLVRGRYYARFVGSDDDPAIRQKIRSLKDALLSKLPDESLPWAYALLANGLKISPTKIQFTPQDAFSFDFATEVYSAKVKGDTEVFVSRRADVAAATNLAEKLAAAFAGFGKAVPGADAKLFLNEYINAVDGVSVHEQYVLGVRSAADAAEAIKWLNQLRDILKASTVAPGSGYE